MWIAFVDNRLKIRNKRDIVLAVPTSLVALDNVTAQATMDETDAISESTSVTGVIII